MSSEVITVHEIGHTKLVTDFSIDLVKLSTTTQLEAHVVAVRAELVRRRRLTLVLILRAYSIGEIRSEERQQGNLIGSLKTILHQNGNLKVVKT